MTTAKPSTNEVSKPTDVSSSPAKPAQESLPPISSDRAHEIVFKTASEIHELIYKRISEASDRQKWLIYGRILNLLAQSHYRFLMVDPTSHATNSTPKTKDEK